MFLVAVFLCASQPVFLCVLCSYLPFLQGNNFSPQVTKSDFSCEPTLLSHSERIFNIFFGLLDRFFTDYFFTSNRFSPKMRDKKHGEEIFKSAEICLIHSKNMWGNVGGEVLLSLKFLFERARNPRVKIFWGEGTF